MIQRNARSGADVDDFSAGGGGFAGQQISLHHVFDVGEVAGLLAIAVDQGFGIFQERGAEFREHAGIRRAGVLARAENVEVPKTDVLQSINTAEDVGVKLTHVFGYAVGRNGFGLHGFDFGQGGRFAVSGRGGGEHHAFHFGVARGDQHVEGALDIDLVGFQGIFHRAGNGSARGEMQHVIGFLHGAAYGFEVVDAALDEGNFVADLGEIFFLAGGEIVEDHHAFAAADEFFDGVGADKARATGNDVSHSSSPPCLGRFASRRQLAGAGVELPGAFPKTRENASGNLKQRAPRKTVRVTL